MAYPPALLKIDGQTLLSCDECGSRLWIYEGEIYCPDCVSTGVPVDPTPRKPASPAGNDPHATICTRCAQMGGADRAKRMARTSTLWAFELQDPQGDVSPVWLCGNCMYTATLRLLAMQAPGQLQAWLSRFLRGQ